MLCLQWGFYFNATKSDYGSDDLVRLADFIDNNTSDDFTNSNPIVAKNTTLLHFLSHLTILSYCLNVPGCCHTFSSASPALLRVCPNTFKDAFLHLFMKLCDLMTVHTQYSEPSWHLLSARSSNQHAGPLLPITTTVFQASLSCGCVIDEA